MTISVLFSTIQRAFQGLAAFLFVPKNKKRDSLEIGAEKIPFFSVKAIA